MSASNGGDKGKRGKKFRPPAKGKDDDGAKEKDNDRDEAALLAKCDKGSEEARRHLEEARRHGTVEDMDTAEEELSVQRSPSPPPSSTLSRSTFRVSNW